MRFLLCVLAIWLCGDGNGWAQEPSRSVQLAISFDEPISGRPALFVFVKGQLAGVAPGTVAIPEKAENVAVEIGIAQLSPAPLFSFAVGPKNFAEGAVEVTMSAFELNASAKGDGVWSGVALNPNRRTTLKLEKGDDGYTLKLPSQDFQTLARYWASRDLPRDQSWFGTVPKSQDASTKLGIDHVSFDKTKDHTVSLAYKADQAWSGSLATLSGVLNGYDLPSEEWTIVSNPPGASIHTDAGPQGSTTSTIRVAKTSSGFVVLTKEGYQQCVSTSYDRQTTSQGVTLICKLTKVHK